MVNVKLYTTPTCPYCRMAKDFFREKNIQYEDIDISTNREAAQELFNKSGQMAVPQIEIEGHIIVGFDKEKLEKELHFRL